MTFLGLKPCFFALYLLSAAQASKLLDPADPTCTLQGSTSEDVCDSTNAADGSSCVWCTVSSYGLCVDAEQAEIIEQSLPMADCGGGGNDDDDDAPPDNDDDVPDDYWTCLKDSSDKDSCEASGCAWCDTKGGYGVCMDKKAAESANTGDWFTCDLADDTTFFVDFVDEDFLSDPLDTSCLAATAQMDEDVCKATKDQDGQPCEWCTVGGSTIMCLNGEQADIATQLGGSCDDTATTATTDVTSPSDPYDMSCLAASVDKDGCFATKDADDLVCEWCAVGSAQLCLSHLQGDIAAQIGASCEIPQDEEDELEVSDPLDPSCLSATVQMDADACKATNDQDGQPCEWCTVGSTPLCLNSEQADIAEQLGGSCDATTDVLDPYSMDEDVSDPLDTSCLEQTLQMDEDACKAAQDGEGQSCEWCTVGSTPLCLNPEQADIASQLGGSCDGIMTESEVTDPMDPSCLAATVQMDEDVCKDTKDQDGQPCEWCTVGSTPLCLNGEQAQIAEQLGGTCDAVDAPYDASCLKNSFNEDACHGKTDGDGNPCQWCSLPRFGTACLNPAQSQAFTQLGGHCEDPIEMSIHIDLASA